MDKRKFSIGDLVRIEDNGKTYDGFSEYFEKLRFKNKVENKSVSNGSKGIVFNKTIVPNLGGVSTQYDVLLLAIRIGNKEVLMDSYGVNKIESK